MWSPESRTNKPTEKFKLPWKLIGDTVEDSIVITFSLKNNQFGERCPNSDTGMTVGIL